MALPPNFLEELRQRLSITRLVEKRVRLTRRGREAIGLCPFHNEKTPSFTVSEDKGFYHCFGCGAHGDVIGFVMQTEGLDFRDAVERLAAEAGMPVPRETPEARARYERQASLAGAMESACRWFEGQLRAAAGRAGLDYLRQRGLGEEAIRNFRLGFAPDSRHGLRAALEKAGVPEAIAIEAGLLIKPEGEGHPYDRFRGRVMFPITDLKGQVIAFGGRALGDEQPKYLNSPETPLFHKGRMLYNLATARKSARERNEIVVVEGYMDVIALAEAGIPNVVAPLGTALTEEQLDLLWRQASEPILCFDGDQAGERAAARAAERALPLVKPALSLRFAWMPQGHDPDSLVRAEGGSGLRARLDASEPLVDVLWRLALADRRLDTPERRSGLRRDLKEVVRRIGERTVAQSYDQEFEARLNRLFAPASAPTGTRGSLASPRLRPGANLGGEGARRGVAGLKRAPYELILATLINHPELIHAHCEAIGELEFPDGELDRVKRAVIDHAARQPRLELPGLRNQLIEQGFSEFLGSLGARTGQNRFTLPTADPAAAEAGLLHIIGMLRERDQLRPELKASAGALGEAMGAGAGAGEAQAALEKFEQLRRLALEGESRRTDVDRMPVGPARK
jgi:DNA primase